MIKALFSEGVNYKYLHNSEPTEQYAHPPWGSQLKKKLLVNGVLVLQIFELLNRFGTS